MPAPPRIIGLNAADRQILADWLGYACARGVDTVIDFSVRPWNIRGVAAIVGVFETNKNQASWLVVRYCSGWTLAHCADGHVSNPSDSLPDILALIDQALSVGGSSFQGESGAD